MKKILLTTMICATTLFAANAQWTTNLAENTRFTADDHLASDVAQAPDGAIYIAIPRPDVSGIKYYLQIIRPDGTIVYPTNSYRLVSGERFTSFTMNNQLLYVDNEGNAIVTVSDFRNSDAGGYSQTAYKISPAGEQLWALDLNEGSSSEVQASVKVTQLSNGNYAFAYFYGENRAGGQTYIKVLNVSKDGEIQWTKVWGDATTSTSYSDPYLVPAKYGQFILVYAKNIGRQIYAHKYDFDGGAVWSADAPVYLNGFIGNRVWTAFQVISDNNGGFFAGWYDDHLNTQISKTYVSHITGNGEQGFVGVTTDGLRISYGYDGYFCGYPPQLAYDADGKFLYVIYPESDVNQSLRRFMAQKINRDGELLWESSCPEEGEPLRIGYEIAKTYEAHETGGTPVFYSIDDGLIQVLPGGKVLASWILGKGNSSEYVPYASIIDVSGEQPVLDTTIVISTNKSYKTNLRIFPLPEENAFAGIWRDFRSTGVSSTNTGDFGQKFYSVPQSNTALKTIVSDPGIVAYEYFDITGKKLPVKPQRGLFLEKAIKTDGGFEVKKVTVY